MAHDTANSSEEILISFELAAKTFRIVEMVMETVMVMVKQQRQQRPLKKQQRHQPKAPQKELMPLRELLKEAPTEPLMEPLMEPQMELGMELKRRPPQQRPLRPEKGLLPLQRQQQPPQLPLGLQQLQLLEQQPQLRRPQLRRPQLFPPLWLWPLELEKRTKPKRFCQMPKASMIVVHMNIMNTQKPKENPKANQNPAAAVATSRGNLFCS